MNFKRNTRTDILNTIVSKYKVKKYLEIGVRNPNENFNLISVVDKDGVDPEPLIPCNYIMTSDEFFNSHVKEKYDLVFVDGLHTAQQSYLDVVNSMKHLNENGFIVMHDCNPPSEYHTRTYEEYLKTRGQWNGDVYKGFLKLKRDYPEWNAFVVDEDFGCAILTKRKLGKEFKKIVKNWDISWNEFEKNRSELLELTNYEEFLKNI